MEENDIRLKKEIERLGAENVALERRNKEVMEFKTKQDLELRSKDYYLKQIRDHGLIPETYEEELTKAMQKIVAMENELQLQQRHLLDTRALYEDKLLMVEDEKKEILDREMKGLTKIKSLEDKLKY